MYRTYLTTIGLVTCLTITASANEGPGTTQPKSREFLFTYAGTVTKLKPNQMAKVWIPIAANNEHQQSSVHVKKLPGTVKQTKEELYGNDMFYIEASADAKGEIPFEVTYKIKRKEVLGGSKGKDISDDLVKRFLQADAKVPVGGKALTLVEGKQLPADDLKLGKALYDIVNDHMTYSKQGTGWGQGDSNWACDSKFGNCTDFHSLFISLTRAQKVPAKFVMGFGIPEKRGKGDVGGYHCWAWFQPKGEGWVPVDISQANQVKKTNAKLAEYLFSNLTEDRVVFTTGRDINLMPQQSGSALNFFIYPYVEVEGQAFAAENVTRRFAYEDVGGASK